MKLDDILLMAYVDGDLSPQERQQVEQEIAASPEVAERFAYFSASRLPFREAFGSQKLPPVPDSLTKKIEELARAHKVSPDRASADQSANDARIEHNAQLPPSAPVRSH